MAQIAPATVPADTWVGLLLSGGLTALASGVIAGLVAYLTVHWTQERGRTAARLVASQAAALAMQRETKAAGDLMHGALVTGQLTAAANSYSTWLQELPFQLPVVTDSLLSDALKRHEGIVIELTMTILQVREAPGAYTKDRYGNDRSSPGLMAWGGATADAFELQRQHLVHALSAHRADQPVPTPPPAWRPPSPTAFLAS